MKFGLTGNFSNELGKTSLRSSFWNQNQKEQGIALRMSKRAFLAAQTASGKAWKQEHA